MRYRLSKDDEDRLLEVFRQWDNAMLMDVVRLIENLIRLRRKDLTERAAYCRRTR